MKKILPLFLLTLILPLTSCTQQMMRAQVRESKVVVLDIGHYYHPERGGQGARTPDKRYGNIEECEYWYRYVGHTARIIREAGYECRICCRGAMPTDKKLAENAGIDSIVVLSGEATLEEALAEEVQPTVIAEHLGAAWEDA